jgi:hypothetical protein
MKVPLQRNPEHLEGPSGGWLDCVLSRTAICTCLDRRDEERTPSLYSVPKRDSNWIRLKCESHTHLSSVDFEADSWEHSLQHSVTSLKQNKQERKLFWSEEHSDGMETR